MPRVAAVIAVAVSALVCGCGVKEDPNPGPRVTPPPGIRPAQALAPAEGRLELIAPAGYADLSGFSDATGCRVSVTDAETSDDVVRLMSTSRYDGALGTGDATVRLITAKAIAPINTRLVRGYADVYDGLKQQPYNSVGGQMFAVPVGRAADVLVWARDAVPGTLNGLASVLDPAQAASYGGQITLPDDWTAIGEAARWVRAQRPDLAITDPYELDRRQFNAVVDVLRHQRPYVQEYWTTDAGAVDAFNRDRVIVGLISQNAAGTIAREAPKEEPVGETLPKEGANGISPAWMVAARPDHPGCVYRWLAHVLEPAVQKRVSQAVHIAPSNRRTCDLLPQAFCDRYHADDDGYYDKVLFRTTPARDCGDDRGRVCMDADDWRRAWRRITG